MIAGHNGAGKSTCYRLFLKDRIGALTETHLDPDQIEQSIRQEWEGEHLSREEFSRLAMKEATSERNRLLDSGSNFSFETVFSDEYRDKLQFMEKAREKGYFVVFLFVGLDSPEKSRARVTARVQKGGHDVPTAKINSRYPRVLENAREGVKIASLALLVDNSFDSSDPEQPAYAAFAIYANGELFEKDEDVPEWAVSFW